MALRLNAAVMARKNPELVARSSTTAARLQVSFMPSSVAAKSIIGRHSSRIIVVRATAPDFESAGEEPISEGVREDLVYAIESGLWRKVKELYQEARVEDNVEMDKKAPVSPEGGEDNSGYKPLHSPDAVRYITYRETRRSGRLDLGHWYTWRHNIQKPGCIIISRKHSTTSEFYEKVILLFHFPERNKEKISGVYLNEFSPTWPRYKQLKDIDGMMPIPGPLLDCRVQYGGPTSGFLALINRRRRNMPLPGIFEVMKGVPGTHVVSDIKTINQALLDGKLLYQEVKFFLGYTEWNYSDLFEEVSSGKWEVAPCGTTVVFED